jgi:hypothetical protein
MMTKFLSLLARAQVVTMDTGVAVDVQMAEVTGQPENQVVRISWTEEGRGAFGTALTEEGLAQVTFDATAGTFKLDDYEGDPVVLKLKSGEEVLTPDSEDVVYILIQEGGSSCELYIHAHSTRADAESDRFSRRDDGSYRTSEDIIEVPVSLANHPMFYEFAEMLVGATTTLGFPVGESEAA